MSHLDLIKGFISLLFLQTSWSYTGKQTLGFIYAWLSLTKASTQDKKTFKNIIGKKTGFNTNPYCAGLLLGIALNNETNLAKEWFVTLQHILGGLGDEFFWRTLRPLLLAIATLLLILGYYQNKLNIYSLGIFKFAPLVFLIPYVIITQRIRLKGLIWGVRYGQKATVFLNELRKSLTVLYHILAYILGVLIVLLPPIASYSLSAPIATITSGLFFTLIILLLIALAFGLLRSDRRASYLLIAGLLIFLIIKVIL
ncbi:MAG: PTS system mannose/fructose/sorbose family transporter subunit IID [candidate division WOR-3 bacterium]|nr:PTS system mannose/fructose/sorbose family transporter subunit IID [candidate division WOR-3 bacterium]